jgi:hypothetical protein
MVFNIINKVTKSAVFQISLLFVEVKKVINASQTKIEEQSPY